MHLPTFPRAMPVTRRVQTDFRGYDHRPGCPEGGIYEMTNGSAADAPLFSTRPGRTLTYPTGGGNANGLFAVDGGLLWCTGQTLYFNGTPVDGCTLVNGPKVFAELGGTVLIIVNAAPIGSNIAVYAQRLGLDSSYAVRSSARTTAAARAPIPSPRTASTRPFAWATP